jgi:hypothetical protein
MRAKNGKGDDSRPVKAVYYDGTGEEANVLKRCAGVHPWSMMTSAYNHLQLQHFGRTAHVEVYDNRKLHGSHTMQRVNGKWEILSHYERNPRHGYEED